MFVCLPPSLPSPCPGWLQDRLCDVLWSDGARWLWSVLQSHGWAHQHRHHGLQQLWGDERCQVCPGCRGCSVGHESSPGRHSNSRAVIPRRSLARRLCPTGAGWDDWNWTDAGVAGRRPLRHRRTIDWTCWNWGETCYWGVLGTECVTVNTLPLWWDLIICGGNSIF